MNLVEMFNTVNDNMPTRPVLYNMDGWISPYASDNWGATSIILKSMEDISRLPPLSDKVDPNKIFTSDISALRTQAADQMKVTKMFEKKLMESLTERGKMGLNENDIMAMQALTSARSSVTNSNRILEVVNLVRPLLVMDVDHHHMISVDPLWMISLIHHQ